MTVPFTGIGRQIERQKPQILTAISDVIASKRLILGEQVAGFEREFSDFCEGGEVIGVGNGFDALYLILKAIGIGRGDEVVVAANTYIATWLSVSHAGGRPIPVEPDEKTYNLNPAGVEKALTARTRAILATHLYGGPAEAEALTAIAERHRLPLIFDAAQAHGASCNRKSITDFGLASAFSFYPTKNLGAWGDAGAVHTRDPALAAKIRALRNYGGIKRYENGCIGVNSRLDEIQAAILRVKLRDLKAENTERRRIAHIYCRAFRDVSGLEVPDLTAQPGHVWHLFVVRSMQRDLLRKKLLASGVETDVHYPKPPHFQKAYSFLKLGPGSFPITEAMHQTVLSLPLYPDMTSQEILHVTDTVMALMGEI